MTAGTMPSRVSLSANFARLSATTKSAQQTRPKPPPIAAPLTSATRGWGSAYTVASMSATALARSHFCACEAARVSFIHAMSPPAQKWLPAPLSTTTRVSESLAASLKAREMARIIWASNAFLASGRFNVMRRTPLGRRVSMIRFMGAWYIKIRTTVRLMGYARRKLMPCKASAGCGRLEMCMGLAGVAPRGGLPALEKEPVVARVLPDFSTRYGDAHAIRRYLV
ncbi:hypothetical protein D9M72_348590 [compost metagenome]